MAGYNGYSMSNNAVKAYNAGMLPASKMVAKLKKKYPKTFKGLTVAILKEHVRYSEWHHTSCKYNATEFYDIQTVFEKRNVLKFACGFDKLYKDFTAKYGKKPFDIYEFEGFRVVFTLIIKGLSIQYMKDGRVVDGIYNHGEAFVFVKNLLKK